VVLPAGRAFASVGVYVLVGALGVPVFSGFQGGAGCLFGPTGGYIWSYLIVAPLVSLGSKGKLPVKLAFSMASIIVCYAMGTLQYMLVTGTESLWGALVMCVFPFVIFDIIKMLGAVISGSKVKNILIKQNLLK